MEKNGNKRNHANCYVVSTSFLWIRQKTEISTRFLFRVSMSHFPIAVVSPLYYRDLGAFYVFQWLIFRAPKWLFKTSTSASQLNSLLLKSHFPYHKTFFYNSIISPFQLFDVCFPLFTFANCPRFQSKFSMAKQDAGLRQDDENFRIESFFCAHFLVNLIFIFDPFRDVFSFHFCHFFYIQWGKKMRNTGFEIYFLAKKHQKSGREVWVDEEDFWHFSFQHFAVQVTTYSCTKKTWKGLQILV